MSDRKIKKIFNRWSTRFFTALISCFLFILLSISSSLARNTPDFHILDNQDQQLLSPSIISDTPSSLSKDLNNPQEFTTFANNFFEQQLSKSHIPGAVISIVKDGKIFFTKGYGYANLNQKIPVDAEKTLFRVASLSKLFTATAAMQLYEKGVMDLHRDINQYLTNWQIHNPYSEPITAARMMMHTDGTTQRLMGLGARNQSQMQSLAEYLPQHMPSINYPPGKFYSYSNHSIALLGYLVEKISGIPFAEYIDTNIFQPLEMTQSTFKQSSLSQNLATGYQIKNSEAKPVPYLYLNIAPAAALMTTATDMAHFMIAHLQNGHYQKNQILQPETTQLMHQTHYQVHPKLPGTGYSFRERLINNKRAIGHLGSLRGYSSSLTLIPEENIGIFIATNSFNNLHGDFINQFFNRYFPLQKPAKTVAPIQLSLQQLQKYAGTYRDMEYPRFTLSKITGVAKEIKITPQSTGTLLVKTPSLLFRDQVENIQLIPTQETGLFYRKNDRAYVFFIEDNSGQVTHLSNPLYPKIGTYQKIPWYETINLHLGLLGLSIIIFFIAVISEIVVPLWQKNNYLSQFNLIRRLAGLIGILNLVFIISLPLYLWQWGGWKLVYGVPPFIVLLLTLPIISSIFSLILLILIIVNQQKNNNQKQQSGKAILINIKYTLITLFAIAFSFLLAYWNLLGWQF